MVKDMNFKKISIVLMALLMLTCSFSAISAADGFSSTSTTTSGGMNLVNDNLTINGINFKVPSGFEQVDSDTSMNDDNFTDDNSKDIKDIDGTAVDLATSVDFNNTNGQKLEVQVGIRSNDQKIESINPANAEQKEIAGKQGYLIKDGDQVKFEYLQDGKIVKIEASNEDIISQVIV